MKSPFLWLLPMLLLLACGTPKDMSSSQPDLVTEYRQLDTLVVTPDYEADDFSDIDAPSYALPPYNPTYTLRNDLLHTKLEVRFNWEKEQVIGRATLRLKPYFYPTTSVTLDAKGFQFKRVSLLDSPDTLAYVYDGQEITIQLNRQYTRSETYNLVIDYVATPSESGGSAAITSDKGLFFINPDGSDGDKPKQIWTQGETENNSRWFPTIDKPIERCTEEIFVTVDARYVTLSNGLLVSSTTNADGTRTDHWKQDLPHAPYLVMLGVGEFAVVKDTWKNIPVEYYVEPEYEQDARAIFPYTPEMLGFFSDVLGVEYPWAKYSQIVVRDFVSGAMENTTAVVFGEFVQRHERELIDELTNEKIVAHEMFHHWFGDLVTCESWANLTLNEGFANYSEYLWMEHKHGRDAADYHMLEEWGGYFQSSRGGIHPLIHYAYADKEDMFDAHSYNKGGSVLHMLRHYVGDEAFFASLKRYLTDHAYTAVEVDELRMAFEDTTGEDLHWFFDQWYLRAGHPSLELTYGYDPTTGEAVLGVNQTQDDDETPAVYQLPVPVDVYQADGSVQRHQIMVNQREQEFRFASAGAPALIVFDPEHVLLAERSDDKTPEQLLFQFYHAPRLYDRLEALQLLGEEGGDEVEQLVLDALRDPFYGIRGMALELLPEESPAALSLVRNMASNEPHSEVRASAITKLGMWQDEQAVALALDALTSARAYNVMAAGLQVVSELDPTAGMAAAKKLEQEKNDDIISAIGSIYATGEDVANLPFFSQRLEMVDGYNAISFYTDYQQLLSVAPLNVAEEGIAALSAVATNMAQSPWRRLSATKALSDLRNNYRDRIEAEADLDAAEQVEKQVKRLDNLITEIKAAETNPELRNIYNRF